MFRRVFAELEDSLARSVATEYYLLVKLAQCKPRWKMGFKQRYQRSIYHQPQQKFLGD